MKLMVLLALWMPLAFDETSGGSDHTSGGSGSDNSDRLDPGECTDVCCDRPPIDGVGMPLEAQWLPNSQGAPNGNPQAEEVDTFSPDDPMGGATASPDGSSACVDVCANGSGELEGPNGTDQSGRGEGGTIEVRICWKFKYPVAVAHQVTTGVTGLTVGGGIIGGPGGSARASTTVTTNRWAEGEVCCSPTNVSS